MMITTNPESRARSLPYLGGIDGLRAVAVLAVLLYHGGITWMPAGFLGVEVFFAISGFLITALLLGEYDATGTISLRKFWIRRARRLLPALFALLIGVVILTLAMAPDVVAQVGRETWAAVLYVSNWFFIIDNQSYFETFGRASPLQHLWSLAVEEQFYLLWPVALLFLLKRFRRRWVFALIVAGIVISTALMIGLWEPRTDPTRVYYGTDTRAAGLLLGAAAAFLLRRFLVYAHRLKRSKAMPWLPDIVGLAALVGLVVLFTRLNAFSVFLYQGGFLLTSVLTIIVIAIVTLPGSRLGTIMATRPLRWVGTRSYALYLWHWPIFVVTRPRLDVTIDGIELLVLRFVITACLAELSYRLVERRFRYASAKKPRLRLRKPAMGAVAATGVVALIVVTASMMGAPEAPAAQDEMIAAADSIVISSEPETSTSPSTSSAKSDSVVRAATTTVAEASADSTKKGQTKGNDPKGSTSPPPTSGPRPDSTADNQPGEKSQDKVPNMKEGSATTDRPRITTDRPARNPDTTATTSTSTSSSTTSTTSTTTTTTVPVPTLPEGVLFVGDSVMLGAHDALVELDTNVAVDARVSRQWWDVVDEVDALGTDAQPPVVVLHLGTNGTVDSETFDVVMGTIMRQEGTRVLIVNARVPQLWEADVNDAIAAGVERWPAATMIDWYAASEDHLEYFVSDGVHLTSEGKDAYGALIEQALLDLP